MINVDWAVKIITKGLGFDDEVKEACETLVNEVKRLAVPLNVERAPFLSTREFGIVFNPSRDVIRVDPILLAFNLRDHRNDTGIPYEDLLWYLVSHEKGHYELKQKGLRPLDPENEEYMMLYTRFEDYAISRFLRSKDEKYIRIERSILRAEARRLKVFSLNDATVLGLSIAHGYIEFKELDLPSKFVEKVSSIASTMRKVKELSDIPVLVKQLLAKI